MNSQSDHKLERMTKEAVNPDCPMCSDELIRKHQLSDVKISKIITKHLQEQELKPYQAELIKLQQYLEKAGKRMVILFEGRDAAGKGGTIRRVTRYMNEKHYRVIALGKPTEEQRTQWYFQKYELIAKLWVKYSGINHNHYMVKEPWFFISYFSQNT